jgi:hypothetical protein
MLRKISSWVAVALLAGCGSLSNLRSDRAPAPTPSNEAIQATQLASYISALQQLVQGSPAEQAEVIAGARAGYEQAHQGPAVLRYALMLAAPGHPARDTTLAQRLLREALARPELLSITERALAIIELQRMDAEIRLTNENARLVTETQRERERERQPSPASNTALTRRLQAETEENARLRKALDEARAKLDAIATIERNISDRPPANQGRNP